MKYSLMLSLLIIVCVIFIYNSSIEYFETIRPTERYIFGGNMQLQDQIFYTSIIIMIVAFFTALYYFWNINYSKQPTYYFLVGQ